MFQIMDCKPMTTPMMSNLTLHVDLDSNLVDPSEFIGSLMYLVNTRPRIFFAVNTLTQFMVERQIHWIARKQVLQYLKGIVYYGLRYARDDELMLHGYINYD
jgi:hypothetical protein